MNCEECKEQVFELIEREAVDPEGVHEILARCPDCRAEFDAMKAALAMANHLPIEEPSADLDASILRKAELRPSAPGPAPAEEAQVTPFRKRLLRAQPWAMAAVALLAIGVGVWSIPQAVRFEADEVLSEPQATEVVPAEEAPAAEQAPEDEEVAMGEVALIESVEETERVTSTARPARRRAWRAKKRRADTPEPATVEADAERLEAVAVEAPAAAKEAQKVSPRAPEQDELPSSESFAAGRATQPSANEMGAAQVSAGAEDTDAKSPERADCQAKIAAFEKRLGEDERYEPAPEQQLAMGRCYQTLGDTVKARKWLERAAKHSSTKAPAQKALQALPPKR